MHVKILAFSTWREEETIVISGNFSLTKGAKLCKILSDKCFFFQINIYPFKKKKSIFMKNTKDEMFLVKTKTEVRKH